METNKKVSVYIAIYVESVVDGQKTEIKITPEKPSYLISIEEAIKFLHDYQIKQNESNS